MKIIKTLIISGYRSYELGIFKEDDPKVAVIKSALQSQLQTLVEEGLEWVLVAGQLGVEMWGAEVVLAMKEDYPELHLGVILPFADFGNQWKENNQEKLTKIKQQADYVNSTSNQSYQSPQQLRNHSRFLLEHSGGVLLVYDEESPGKTSFFLKEAKQFQENYPYEIFQITFDDLQNVVASQEEFYEDN
ncbi:putative phage-like protein YoqJ [Enterococcus sp. PF1-24]|uniref:DUF1273 domain-containing protein n=1 Tax=unclassified Enterococcus TaxID=2608891 RepID=UPI00247675ED|nr:MULTISPECIES: DUF1273 domain-containing protein [unclassified Enterococcus]MDH6365154.1 putative phage-like protein YoqJ [Enterococcus sp. PFB1-1]MDH6402262.1 putative phage-like protein YoqJ [Enterococcus sp. PF1-24]